MLTKSVLNRIASFHTFTTALLSGVALLGSSTALLAADASIRVAYDQPSHKIPARMVGAFFEDINFGADGGFNAELVKNSSFETPAPLLGWSAIGEGVKVTAERDAPIKAQNPTFLRLQASREAVGGGVSNPGYRGMGVKEGELYHFSAYARTTAGRTVKLQVEVIAESGDVIAEHQLEVSGSEWKLVEVDLKPSRTEGKARLRLKLQSPGTLDLDLISLYPRDTWKGRPHGMRKDLVQLLADLKPAFFRFPGGCIVEGSQLKYRYQWKTTIGPRDERRLIVNRWNTEFAHRLTPDYYQSFNIGFFEFFQLAEDVGAEPMPILGCGMACQFNSGELVPLEELDPYIQDALDLIEFANGPVDSEWGAKRAAMGHPEPFNMRLLGVGNEQWGPEYFERYTRFAEVLEREHPEVELISTSGPFPSGERFDYAWPILKKLDVPIVDEHCYAMPDWFMREATRYDNYDRNGPEIFMGEYAAQSIQIVSPLNRNNLKCALAEAAFLTGIERNSDIVTMSAYAPMMAHEEAWQWRPNLMWFDNLGSYGSPSYYVQQIFSVHRGDTAVPVELTDNRPQPTPGGRIGLGSYGSSVEFRNLKVTHGDKVLLDGSKLNSTDGMTHCGGDWQVQNGTLMQKSRRGNGRLMLGDYGWGDCTISLQARKTAGREGFVVFCRHSPGNSRIEWNIGGNRNREHQLIGHLAAHSDTPNRASQVAGSIEAGRWYDVRIEVSGSQVKCYLDDKLIHDVDLPDPEIARLFASASKESDTGEVLLKVVNPTDSDTAVSLNFAGLGSVSSSKAVVMSGEPDDENSVAEPKNVSPVEKPLQIGSSEFEYTFPRHSFTVLKLTP